MEPAGGPAGSTVGVPRTWMEEKSIAGTSATGGCVGRMAAGLGGLVTGTVEVDACAGGAVELHLHPPADPLTPPHHLPPQDQEH